MKADGFVTLRRSLLRRSRTRSCVAAISGVVAVVLILSCLLSAQDPTDDTQTTQHKMMSKTERSQLSEKTDLKDRTNLALQFMDLRMKSAEKFRTDENYSLMYAELGGFHALMDN